MHVKDREGREWREVWRALRWLCPWCLTLDTHDRKVKEGGLGRKGFLLQWSLRKSCSGLWRVFEHWLPIGGVLGSGRNGPAVYQCSAQSVARSCPVDAWPWWKLGCGRWRLSRQQVAALQQVLWAIQLLIFSPVVFLSYFLLFGGSTS